MIEKLKELGGMGLGILIFIGILAIPVLFLKGSVWASTHLLKPLTYLGWIVLAVDLIILLPLSIFRRLRGFTGGGIMISSYLFGLVTWLLGFVITYSLWGMIAVIIGFLIVGVGVVPIAMLALAINGYWAPFFTLVVLILVTYGSRIIGASIAASVEEYY